VPLIFILLGILPRETTYLDPGTGSYIIQLAIGALMGGLFLVGVYWKKLVRFITRKKDIPAVSEEPLTPEDSTKEDEKHE
jgi:hypothetical protein